jgi:hypothetical protein
MILVPLAFCNCIQVVFDWSVFMAGGTGQCILFSDICARLAGFVESIWNYCIHSIRILCSICRSGI